MESRAGQLLIASAALQDPNFARTVTLIVEHTDDGTLGLVLNRPTTTLMRDAWSHVSESPCHHEGWVHHGGPCEGPLMAVHRHAGKGQYEPVGGVYVTADAEDLTWLMEHNEESMVCFVGYAGWAAGQLEAELETGSWLLWPADFEQVFEGGDRQWLELLRRVDPLQAALVLNPRIRPSDPSMN